MKKFALWAAVPLLALLTACASITTTQDDRTVHFEFGKSALTSEARAKLDNLVTVIRNEGVQTVSVVGYADRIGNASANDALSRRRAEVVRSYLAHAGVGHAVVGETRWVGDTESKTACGEGQSRATIACLSPDRKVVVEFVDYIKASGQFCHNSANKNCPSAR